MIGSNLKRIRQEQKLTQAQLADELFISRSTLSGYENGKPINPDMIAKICDALHTDPNHLFGVATPPSSPTSSCSPISSSDDEGAGLEQRSGMGLRTRLDKDLFMKVGLRKLEEMYEELK